MKYFMVRQQRKGNALLHSSGNTEHVYVADSHIYANNKGMYCYDHMATVVTVVRSYNESLYIVYLPYSLAVWSDCV
jgi:hypothetical protein